MKEIRNEDTFQKWVKERFRGNIPMAHVQDFSDRTDDVPDLNIAGNDGDADQPADSYHYWLELKFDWFRLGHDKYDDFKWSTLQRAQIEWLWRRAQTRTGVCGILGYVKTFGDNGKPKPGQFSSDYLVFHTVEQYFEEIYTQKVNCGAVLLGPRAIAAHYVKTGRDLMRFLDHAAAACLGNAA